jgi:serine phosphatase RsbU (regulator of sigma subunit)
LAEKKGCVLIVDDEEDFRELLRIHLEDFEYEVLEAEDGQEALEIFEEEGDRIDLVITDIRMPRLDGEALIREIQQRSPYIPIIGVTGHMDLQDTLRLMGHGAYYYLHKPLDPWPIADRLVDNAVRFHRNERAIARSRKKEFEIARLIRTYIVSNQSLPAVSHAGHGHSITLEIAAKPIDRDRPSGDFAEWFRRSAGEVCFYLADASGHDELLPCFLSCLSNMVLHRSHHGVRPTLDQLLSSVDHAVSALRDLGALPGSKYLTVFLSSINLEFGEMTYINAGHPAPFLFRPGSSGFRRLEGTGRPVGFFGGEPATLGRERLRPGDVLFVYTDGASELLQGDDEAEAGFRQLEEILEPLLAGSAQEIVDGVAERLLEAAGKEGLQDDTTLVAIKVHAVD